MSMTFQDEYINLTELIRYKEYRRYGDDLYAQYVFDGGYEWKYEYNICEFVWGFVKNPCFAPRLVEYLEKNIVNMRKYLKILANGNKKVRSTCLYNKWDAAMNVAELSKTQSIIYSTENSHLMLSGKMVCNDVDGELWHGMLMTTDFADSLTDINVELSGLNSDGFKWSMDYRFTKDEVQKDSRFFDNDSNSELLFYSPFKHPLILLGSDLKCVVSFNTIDNVALESQVNMVYGLCCPEMRNLIKYPTNTFTCELCRGSRLVIDTSNGVVDEISCKQQ